MWFSWVALAFSIGILFFLPLQYALILLIYVFSLVVWYEFYRKSLNLLDVSIWITYGFIGVIYYIFRYEDILPFTGSIIYSVLSVMSILGILLKRPFTMTYRKNEESQEISRHMFLSGLLGSVFLVSLYLSLTLFPSPTYIYVPLLVSIGGSFIAVMLGNKVWNFFSIFVELRKIYGNIFFLSFDKHTVRKRIVHIKSENYAVRISSSEKDEKDFFELLEKAYLPVYLKSEAKIKETYHDFLDGIKKEYEKFKNDSYVFLCQENISGKSVGCIRFVFCENRGKLPLEEFLGFSLDFLRERGVRCCEVGRLAILGDIAKKGEILEGFGNMFLPFLVAKGIDVVFVDAVADTKVLYEKVGFLFIERTFFDKETLQRAELGFLSTYSYLLHLEERIKDKKNLLSLLRWVYTKNLLGRKLKGELKVSLGEMKENSWLFSLIKDL